MKSVLAVLLVLGCAVAPLNAQYTGQAAAVVETLQQFSTFVPGYNQNTTLSILESYNIVNVLNTITAGFTLLSPVNSAWTNLSTNPTFQTALTSNSDAGKLLVVNLMLFHLLSAPYTAAALLKATSGAALGTLLGEPVFVTQHQAIAYFYADGTSSPTNYSAFAMTVSPDEYTQVVYPISIQSIADVLIPINMTKLLTPNKFSTLILAGGAPAPAPSTSVAPPPPPPTTSTSPTQAPSPSVASHPLGAPSLAPATAPSPSKSPAASPSALSPATSPSVAHTPPPPPNAKAPSASSPTSSSTAAPPPPGTTSNPSPSPSGAALACVPSTMVLLASALVGAACLFL